MYVPAHFSIADRSFVREILAQGAFAALVTTIDGAPFATHLPLLHVEDGSPNGKLVGHVARANPHWKAFDGAGPSLAVFSGPHAYISPSWYATPAMVPTWNYVAVHATGRPRVLAEPAAAMAVLERLTATFEAGFERPWSIAGMPPGRAEAMLPGIVAFEMPVERFEAKGKLSQNRAAADVEGAASALERLGGEQNLATAALMRRAAGG